MRCIEVCASVHGDTSMTCQRAASPSLRGVSPASSSVIKLTKTNSDDVNGGSDDGLDTVVVPTLPRPAVPTATCGAPALWLAFGANSTLGRGAHR